MAESASNVDRWRSRIVQHRKVPPEALLDNPLNFRRHPKQQRDALAGVINEIGFLDPILVQAGTGLVINGHLRLDIARETGQPTVEIIEVDLSDEEVNLALATFDPISALAETDTVMLNELLHQTSTTDPAVMQMLADLAESSGLYPTDDATSEPPPDTPYSLKVDTPIYTPTGEEPALADLADTTRYDALVFDIDASDLPDDVKHVLRLAATRHIVFDYRKLAEFYAHADAPTQRLMEDSALVIIDINRAIELGYAKLRTEMEDMLARAQAAKRGEGEEEPDV